MCTRKFWWSAIICLSYLLAVHQSHCPLIHRLKVFLILLSKKLTASPHFLYLSSSSMKCSPVLSFSSHHCSYPLLLLLTFRFKFFKVFCLLPTYAKSFFFWIVFFQRPASAIRRASVYSPYLTGRSGYRRFKSLRGCDLLPETSAVTVRRVTVRAPQGPGLNWAPLR